MTVAEFIEYLKKQPQDLQVAYKCCSEHMLLSEDQIEIEDHCEPRPDGWIQNRRPDMLPQTYLLLPGN